MTSQTGYDSAKREIAAGTGRAFALWALLSEEGERDGFALRPMPWEGPGEYQHVTLTTGSGFVRLRGASLPTAKAEGR